jgi:nicotinate-nucleotide adenylyltransferase
MFDDVGVRRVGLVGGTFDPIHNAHLMLAEEVRAALGLSEIVFIPAGQPPHKLGHHVTAVQHRLAMLELAIAPNPHFSYSRVELDRSGPSYLVDTLRILHEQWGAETALNFILGWDSLEELHTWYDPQGILAQLAHLVVVRRPGYKEDAKDYEELEARLPGTRQRLVVVPMPLMEISSRDLRQRVATGRPIKYQVPEAVEEYIVKHDLYLI